MLSIALVSKFPIRAMTSFRMLSKSVQLAPAQKPNLQLQRDVHNTGGNNHTQRSSLSTVPRLIYVQNPLSWLRNKIYLQILKFSWDRQFVESDFKRGAKQVI